MSLAAVRPYPECFSFPLSRIGIQSKGLSPTVQSCSELAHLVIAPLMSPSSATASSPFGFAKSLGISPAPWGNQFAPRSCPFCKPPFLGKEYRAQVDLRGGGPSLHDGLVLPCRGANWARPSGFRRTLPCGSPLCSVQAAFLPPLRSPFGRRRSP